MTNHTHAPAVHTRRTVLRTAAIGAAWTTPAILGVAAAPAIAASTVEAGPEGGLGARPPAPPAEVMPPAPAGIHINPTHFEFSQQPGYKLDGSFGVEIAGPGLVGLVTAIITLSHPDWKQSQSLSFAGAFGQSLVFRDEFQFSEKLIVGETYTAEIMFSGTLKKWINYTTSTEYEGSWELESKTLPAKSVTIAKW